MRRWLLIGLGLLGAGCLETWTLDPPPAAEGARSVVVVFEDEAHPEVWAQDLEPGDALDEMLPAFRVTDSLRTVHVAQLGCSVGALGWRAGRQVLGPREDGVVPDFVALTEHRPVDAAGASAATDWAAPAQDILRRVATVVPASCPRLVSVPLPVIGRAGVATAEGNAVVALVDGRIVHVTRDGRIEDLPGDGLEVRGIHRVGEQLYYVDRTGPVVAARLGEAPASLSTQTWPIDREAQARIWMDGGTRSDGVVELAAQVDASGRVFWFREGAWSYSGCETPRRTTLTYAGLTRLDAGRVLAVGHRRARECVGTGLLREYEQPNKGTADQIEFTSVVSSPELGVVVSSFFGALWGWPTAEQTIDDFAILPSGNTDRLVVALGTLGPDKLLVLHEEQGLVWDPTSGGLVCPGIPTDNPQVLQTMPIEMGAALLHGATVTFLEPQDVGDCGRSP